MSSTNNQQVGNTSDSEGETTAEETNSGVNTEKRTINFTPNKEDIYRAVMADVDIDESFLELTDNAIDNWERVSSKTDDLLIEIFQRTTENGEREVVVRDNSGGVPVDELDMLFSLGSSAKDEIVGSVGAYGIGMKKAILRLADEATIATRHKEADTGYGFSVDKEWIEEGGWDRPIEDFDIPAGITEIRLRRLNFNPTRKFADLQDELETTYEIFLGGGPRPEAEEYDFEIRIGDEPLEASDPVNWSSPPFDGLHPRQFRNIEIDSREASAPVMLHVTVGLLQKADMETSGTDVYLQQRKVHHAATDEQGGFGASRYLGEYKDSEHKRLKIIVELETEGDARDLPWTSSKNSLDLDSQIAKQAFNWVGRLAQRYYKASYQALPQTIFRPYGLEAPHAAEPDLGVNAHDFSGREKVTSQFKPAEGFPTANQIIRIAEAHARLGIKYPGVLPDEQVPAYEEHHAREFNAEYYGGSAQEFESDPGLDLDTVNVTQAITRLDQWATHDAHAGKRLTGLEPWEEPRYEATLESHLPEGEDIEDLEPTTDRDRYGTDGADSGDEDNEETDGPSGSEFGVESGEDRELFTLDCTDEQVELFDRVLRLEDDFADATPADRADAIEHSLTRFEAVLEVAGHETAPADD